MNYKPQGQRTVGGLPRLGLLQAEVESGGVRVMWRSGRLRGIRQHIIELE